MSQLNPTISLRSIKLDNLEAAQGIFCLGIPSASYYSAAISSSTDPLASKTNKYAESKIIRVAAMDKAIHIKFGTSAVSAATTSDHMVPAGAVEYFGVDANAPYIRVIENAATAKISISEIY